MHLSELQAAVATLPVTKRLSVEEWVTWMGDDIDAVVRAVRAERRFGEHVEENKTGRDIARAILSLVAIADHYDITLPHYVQTELRWEGWKPRD